MGDQLSSQLGPSSWLGHCCLLYHIGSDISLYHRESKVFIKGKHKAEFHNAEILAVRTPFMGTNSVLLSYIYIAPIHKSVSLGCVCNQGNSSSRQ